MGGSSIRGSHFIWRHCHEYMTGGKLESVCLKCSYADHPLIYRILLHSIFDIDFLISVHVFDIESLTGKLCEVSHFCWYNCNAYALKKQIHM